MSSESQIIRTEYSDVMRKSYIDYAMSDHIPCPSGCERRTETGTETDTLRYV